MFEEKIKKPMKLYLQVNALNTIIANTMEKSKLGEASFYENEIVINDCNEHDQTSESTISYKHVIFCGALRPCEKNQIREEYCIHHSNEKTRTWGRALNDLGEKVCALYPFVCELCYKVGHFNLITFRIQ